MTPPQSTGFAGGGGAIPLVYDDPRPISGIHYHGEDAGGYTVGFASVTEIRAYREHGQSDFTPFLAVFQGEHLRARVPASAVTIYYEATS